MTTDEFTVARLLSAAEEHRVILIPARDELHIINRPSVPTDLIDMLHLYEREILATLRGLAIRAKHQ